MRDYGVVSPKFWIGDTGKKLRGDPVCQVIALYLMTSPHAVMTGVYHCPVLYISHETGTPLQGANKALRRLIEAGYCEYEEASETVFVIRMAAHQVGESLKRDDKRVLGLKREVERMTSARLKQRFLEVYGKAFRLVPDDWNPSPLEGPSQPLRSQDQDQDQDQEQEQEQEQESTFHVDRVFAHWKSEWNHPTAKLDKKREKAIQAALKLYPPETLCSAISGFKKSEFHTGRNDRNTVYDGLPLLLRDADQIEKGVALANGKGAEVGWH